MNVRRSESRVSRDDLALKHSRREGDIIIWRLHNLDLVELGSRRLVCVDVFSTQGWNEGGPVSLDWPLPQTLAPSGTLH